MRMSGITLLGDDVNPAMKGANAQAFSIKEDDLHAQMIKVMSELKESLDKYAAIHGETSKEGGLVSLDKFNELLEQYGKTAEEIDFEYEGLSDEELEAKFAAAFAASEEAPVEDDEPEDEPEDGGELETDDEPEDKEDPEIEENCVKYTVEYNGITTNMSVSLQDKINALYELVNTTYEDDGTWYSVDVYDEEKYVIMVDLWNNKGYKQSYKVKKDVYTLVGDRVEVFAQWLTQDEINKLDKMKSDFAEISDELQRYKDEPKKMEVLTSEDYSLIADNEEFVALCEQDNHFNMSIDEVTKKADEILTSAAKAHKFSAKDQMPVTVKPFPASKKKAKRFGTLFDGMI